VFVLFSSPYASRCDTKVAAKPTTEIEIRDDEDVQREAAATLEVRL
jgi:hypothetical protein